MSSLNNLRNLRPRYSLNYSNRTINYFNDIEKKEEKDKSVQSERKIKEIIINKKIKKTNDDIDNSKNSLNNSNVDSKKLLENQKPIQVNLKINTFDKSQNCHTNVDSYESLNNNNDKSEMTSIEKINNYKIEIKQFRRKMKKFNTTTLMQNHFNINTNLKKRFKQNDLINKNNSFDNEENNDIEDKNKDNNITFIDKIKKYHSNNYFINKNNWTCKTIKTIYYKNKIKTNISKTENTVKKSLTNDKNKNTKKEETNLDNYKRDILKKDNITQFQILPIKKNIISIKKLNNDKKLYILKEKKKLINEKDKNVLEKKKNIKGNNSKNDKKLIKLNTYHDNKFKYNKNYLYNSTIGIKIGETFKNSIRNKYKREKSIKKKD